jgi:hypothetical protein
MKTDLERFRDDVGELRRSTAALASEMDSDADRIRETAGEFRALRKAMVEVAAVRDDHASDFGTR